jgi:hypothetical protein
MSTEMPPSNRMRSPAAEAAQHNENETMGITLPSFTPAQESLFLTLGGRALEFYRDTPPSTGSTWRTTLIDSLCTIGGRRNRLWRLGISISAIGNRGLTI